MITDFKKRRRVGLVLICCCLIVGSFYYMYRIFAQRDSNIAKKDDDKISVVNQNSIDTVKNDYKTNEQENQLVIGVNTVIKYKTFYAKCGHIEENINKAGLDLIGLDYEKASKKFDGWVIEKFSVEEVVLFSSVEGLDKQCLENSYIGVKDGLVTVFYGKPMEGTVVRKLTNISVSSLPASEVADLNQGIPVSNDQEIYEILEGLSSLERY